MLLKEKVLPRDNVIPLLCRKAHKSLKDVGVECHSFHACINECILYKGPYEKLTIRIKCDTNRYHSRMIRDNIPQKNVHNFSIIPKIYRIFWCNSIA